MASYDEISREWFFLRHPRAVTYQEFEADEGRADREKTRRILETMRREVPKTALRELGIDALSEDMGSLRAVDARLSADVAKVWLRRSDPEDPNNDFKLTLSEFAVFFGQVLIKELGGTWRCARMPNFFQSVVESSALEFLVFDSLMKRVSDDFGSESLVWKLEAFRNELRSRTGPGPQ